MGAADKPFYLRVSVGQVQLTQLDKWVCDGPLVEMILPECPATEGAVTPEPIDISDKLFLQVRVRISRTDDPSQGTVIDTIKDRDAWSWWNGTEWVPFPEEGVPPASKVRCHPSPELAPGVWYHDAQVGVVKCWYPRETSVYKFTVCSDDEDSRQP